MDADKKRKLAAGLAKQQRRRAETRRCPKCGRKGALENGYDDLSVWSVCRWGCGYESIARR